MTLDQEIREVKRKSFPELKFCRVKGIYLPDSEIFQNDNVTTMHIKFLIKGYLFGVKPYHIGYATIKLPELLYGEKLHEARQGTIVHELCHLVHSYDTSENIINKEVVKRGYLYQLVASTIILSNHERFKSHSTKTFLKRDLY